MELFHAHRQWAERPADQRFHSLQQLFDVCRAYALQAREKMVRWADLRVEAVGDELALVGKANVPATLTHYAFGQVASRIGAPGSYLRLLPATLAAQNMNYGFANNAPDGDAQLLFHTNGSLLLRAATSERYSRIWNYEVVQRLKEMASRYNLVPATATTNQKADSANEQALYASDHDMFAFLMSPDRSIVDPVGQELRRGVIVSNSEVGAASLKFMGFLFREICGNHIIWGAQQISEISLRHVGSIGPKMMQAAVEIRRYLDGAASLEEAKFTGLRTLIAGDKDEVLDKLFGIRSLSLPRKTLAAAYDAVVPAEDGDPRSVWGMAQGLTRTSQQIAYADERTQLDRAAGKLLEIEF